MLTADISQRRGQGALHTLTRKRLQITMVSSTSFWGETIWTLDADDIYGPVRIYWNIDLPNGRNLLDPELSDLLHAAKASVWCSIANISDRYVTIKVRSLENFVAGLKHFLFWMIRLGVTDLRDVTTSRLELFRESLSDELLARYEGEEIEITRSVAYNRLRIPGLVNGLREALASFGVSSCAKPQWSAHAVATELATKADGQIMPIPSEVSVRILNAAARYIGTIADDIIACALLYLTVRTSPTPGGFGKAPGKSAQSRLKHTRRRLSEYEFSVVPGEMIAWRPPFEARQDGTVTVGATVQLQSHISDLMGACSIVLQGLTAMRFSEAVSLEPGIDEETGLPSCVSVATTLSGRYEIFLVSSVLIKTEESPLPENWVIGLRPVGSNELPMGVRALVVLNRLLELRESTGQRLFYQTRPGSFASSHEENGSSISNSTYSAQQKRFIRRNVDLSAIPDTSARAVEAGDLVCYRESAGECIRPAQWRKSFAHFVFNVDARLLPALTDQFKHLNAAMTEGSYLGTSQALFEALDGVRAQETAMILFEMATGRSLYEGRMGTQIMQNIDQVKQMIAHKDPKSGFECVIRFVLDERLRVWFTNYGNCLPLSAHAMECHKVAGTRPTSGLEPNYSARTSSTCAGCAGFLYNARHAPFWMERYRSSSDAWTASRRLAQSDGSRLLRVRASQAKAMLANLGIDPEKIVEG